MSQTTKGVYAAYRDWKATAFNMPSMVDTMDKYAQ